MSSRDDMVFGVSAGPADAPGAQEVAHEERQRFVQTRALAHLAAQHGRRFLLRTATRAASGVRAVAAARFGAPGLVRGGGAGIATGVGALVAGLVVAGVVVLRLASGQPLEGTAETLNRMFLGDLDDDARAKMATRAQISGDSDLARIAGQEGKVNSQIASVFADLHRRNKEREVGASMLREQFPANNIVDALILRAQEVFLAAWNGNGGPDAVERLRAKYRESFNTPGGKAGGR